MLATTTAVFLLRTHLLHQRQQQKQTQPLKQHLFQLQQTACWVRLRAHPAILHNCHYNVWSCGPGQPTTRWLVPLLRTRCLPQVRQPQSTVFDGANYQCMKGIQETRVFLSINNYDFLEQWDSALQSDQDTTLNDVTTTTGVGKAQCTDLQTTTETMEAQLQEKRNTPEDQRPPARDSDMM